MAHILVVDDEPAVRETLVGQINALRHRCTEAENGLEALERLHEREFDLIITDVMMPKLNGFQLIERALPYLKGRVPIVILSSVDDVEGATAAIEAGAYDYLNKPIDREGLQRVIDDGLGRRDEMVRLLGRHRGRGGPVPAAALGERERDQAEAPVDQAPAGVPAVREERTVLAVPRPGGDRHAPAPARRSVWHRFAAWLLRRDAA